MDGKYSALLKRTKESSPALLKCSNYFRHVDKLKRVQNRATRIKGLQNMKAG